MDNALQVEVTCPSCKKSSVLTLPKSGYERWRAGEYIQKAMPDVKASDREMLMSGMCPTCWKEMFGEED